MALEGKIKDFGVADIIQLVSQQQKSGVLCVENPDGRAEISFLNGNITGAKPSEYKTSHPLGEMLVASKRLSEKNLKKALKEQEKTFEYLGQILVKEGFVMPEDIEKALMTQIYETSYDMLQWKDGTYRFEPKKIIPDPNLPNAIPVESMLLDVLRMIDEWPSIEAEIPGFDMVFHRVPGAVEESLDQEDADYYRLVDGKKTLQEIIDTSLSGKFSTCKALIELTRNGYVEGVAAQKKVSEGSAFDSAKVLKPLSYAAAGLILCAVILLPLIFSVNIFPLFTPGKFKASAVQRYLDSEKVVTVEKVLEMYRMKEGPYPEKLSDLVAAGFLTEEDIQLSDGSSLEYVRSGRRYKLKASISPE